VDERKKTIRELEEKKGETLENLDKLRKSWGETLLARLDREESDQFSDELGQYRRFRASIALFRGRIRALEDDTLRLRDLEKTLEEREKTAAEKIEALKDLYAGLGEIVLRHDAPVLGFEASHKAQAEDLAARIGAQEERLRELEEAKTAGFFSWIRSSARGALIRSRLAKSRMGLNRIHGAAGEQFFALREGQGEGAEIVPAGDIPERIGTLRQDLALLQESNASAREEWAALRESLGIEGNSRNFSPGKKIRDLEQRIAREEEQLGDLYADFAGRLYSRFAGAETGETAGESAWLLAEDAKVLERIREMLEQIAGHEAGIEKLKASLRIDEKREAIARMQKSILSHRQRIAASENAIAGLEKTIEESNRHIEALMKL
jgi:hypothetical protein